MSIFGKINDRTTMTTTTNENHGPDNNNTDTIAWTDLLAAQGAQLWALRAQAFHGSKDKNNNNATKSHSACPFHHMIVGPARPDANVCVFLQAAAFVDAERNQGMDKPDTRRQHGWMSWWLWPTSTPTTTASQAQAQPLTLTVGDEWVRQRRILTGSGGPLRNLPQQTRWAARAVEWERMVQNGVVNAKAAASPSVTAPTTSTATAANVLVVDLKQVVSEMVCEWAVRLFQGREDAALQQCFLDYWREIRKPNNNNNENHEATRKRRALMQAISWEDGDGLFQAFDKANYNSPQEARENALHAMVAGADAAACLVFWTLWNLSASSQSDGGDNDLWSTCCQEERERQRRAEQEGNINDEDETDLDLLGSIKQCATKGQPIPMATLRRLSCLGKCLMETVRVFPPVWTLPRAWKGADAVSAKLDVPTANRAGGDPQDDWNPWRFDDNDSENIAHSPDNNNNNGDDVHHDDVHHDDDTYYIASFGLGKRACPAGTAALVAARIILGKFVQTFDGLEECQFRHALDSAYLGPTLAVDGEQWFRLKRSNRLS